MPIKISNSLKGFLLALISVFAVSNVYIFSKAALQEVHYIQFGFWWFAFALIWLTLYLIYKKSFNLFKEIPTKLYSVLIVLGMLDILDTYFFFKAIHTITNPSVVAFISNISPAFIIIASILYFKERFNIWESLGIILALLGAFVISYRGNDTWRNMFVDGTQYILIMAVTTTLITLIIKKNIQKVSPIILVINRTVFLFVFFVLSVLIMRENLSISNFAMQNILIGSLLGPFLAAVSGYLALQFIPVSQKAIFDSTRGLIVLIGAYLYFGKFPEPIAIIGGLISIVGVLFIAFGKLILNKKT
jgi:drug/metabolite transporter (DMT)-like permease